ncbi:carboxypeptidase regulatory-like domain-containing protein [Prevotella dentasini]|uniref:carboxypeptidase regulatory-like domain-containing protein n=1 Tax=Prevotella dentasini TaxID=589537 RepID=UPI000468B1F7|nr:carboxypeptidase regulatory-like domain-containing protein [Prevotella dentasini]
MRKTTLLILVLSLLTIGLRAGAQEAFGWCRGNSQTPSDTGPCSFDVSDPAGFRILRAHDFSIRAGAFAGKKYYVQTCGTAGSDPEPEAFGTYDFDTGTFTKIADCGSGAEPFYDMAYDYKNGIMYALGNNGRQNTLLRVDLGSGEATEVAGLNQEFVGLAADLQGQLYAENVYSELVRIDTDGNEETMNSCDYTISSELQSMAIDHGSGKLWWAARTTREGTQLLDINLADGFNESNTEIAGERQIVGLGFPFSTVKDGAPGMVENLEIVPASAGSKEVRISFDAPQKTASGAELGTFKIHLLRGGREIFVKNDAAAGEHLSFTETVTDNGLYAYKAYASNGEGNGEETVKQAYIGEDLPDAVTGITLGRQPDGKSCTISWTAPVRGIDGGYIPSDIRYEVRRMPDDILIGGDIAGTAITDNTVARLAVYQYLITPIGRGRGKEALSEKIILGTSHAIPYQCSFTADDMPLWTVIDRNHDNITWKQRMSKEGVYCSYNETEAGDDWMISHPIAMKGGTKYKITVTAAAANLELTEKMNLWAGLGDKEEQLTQFRQIAKFEVANEEGSRADYVAYYTPAADCGENIAIQMNSDPNKFQLEVFGIVVKEASEGSLHGTVEHAGTPLEGVEIRLKDTGFAAKTDERGEWSMAHVPEADYTLEARKEGYALHAQAVRVSSEQDTAIGIELRKIEKVSATGRVTYLGGTPLAGARVMMTAIDGTAATDEHVAYTDSEGNYTVDHIYEGAYLLSAIHPGLFPERQEVRITKDAASLPTLNLKDKAVAPRMVTAKGDGSRQVVKWGQPVDTDSLSYCKGPGVAHIGVFSFTDRSIVGTVFRKDMAITAVKWQTDEFRGPHKKVDLVVFALDAEGNPTSNIIYEQKDIANTDNQWCRYELPQPLIVRGGALVAFRYNGFLSMLADAGVNGGLDFEPNVHVINSDYQNAPFEYLDIHDMKKNLLIGIDHAILNADSTAAAGTLQRQKQYNVYRRLEKEGEDWQYLASTDAAVREYSDTQFGTLPMGYYRYAVTSVTEAAGESGKALSDRIGRNILANVSFKVKANAAMPSTPPVIMMQAEDDKETIYTATKKDETTWTVEGLAKKKYAVRAGLDGFDDIDATLAVEGEETEFSHELDFTERLLPAYNLKAEEVGAEDSRMLSWNTDNYFFDDFESYEPFTVEPATKEVNWIYWDMDKAETVEFDNITFKFMGLPMSYMAFNPYETTPSLAFFDAGSQPYSGKQYLASFGNRTQANNDFVFSPIVNFTGKATFRFVIKSFTNSVGKAAIRVGYTDKEYPKTLSDISWISETTNVSDQNWQEMSFDVPENARRMVLLNETPRGYFLMIDNMFVGEEAPYADGSVKKPLADRATYEVKLDGSIVDGIDQTGRQVMLNALAAGEHTAEVTAVYESGRSKTKAITFTTEPVSGINEANADSRLAVYTDAACDRLRTSEAVTAWQLFDFKGALVKKGSGHDIDIASLHTGIYIMKLSGETSSRSIKIVRRQ